MPATLMQPQSLDDLSAEHLREMTTRLLTERRHSQALNAKLTHENALLKHMKSQPSPSASSPSSAACSKTRSKLAAVAIEIEQLQPPGFPPKLLESQYGSVLYFRQEAWKAADRPQQPTVGI